MTIVLNSTPLIYLAKVGLISIIEETEDDSLIPGLVFDEVVTVGKQRVMQTHLSSKSASNAVR